MHFDLIMSRYLHLPIFQKAYDLNLEIYKTTPNFPREYKYTLGQNIKEIAGNFLDGIVAANSEEDKSKYFPAMKTQVEQLRIKLRLGYDLKIINSRRLEFLNRLIEEISKQVSGWEKWFFENFSEARIFSPSALAEGEKRASFSNFNSSFSKFNSNFPALTVFLLRLRQR